MAAMNAGNISGAETVKVVIRCRPLSRKETEDKRKRIIDVNEKKGVIDLRAAKAQQEGKQFTFDMVFDSTSSQDDVYQKAAQPIVDSTLEGYNGTIFAYGQTGTGKTHTMEGKEEPRELQGIIPNAFRHVFEYIDGSQDTDFLIRASFLELYNEDIRDLLSKDPKNKLELKEHPDKGIYVKDLTSFVVKGVADLKNVLAVGKKNRTVGATLMNQDSSRSHSIFTITIESSSRALKEGEEAHIRVGKLNLVDLAGSERQSKTGATGARLKEATKINLSLSALGNVISSLVDGKSKHIPYRDSKLTRLLQDSLGGNTKTVMIANIGPADYNFHESLSTLRYANRAKNIKNKPKINEDPKDAMLREYQDEIKQLKAMLEKQSGAGSVAMSPLKHVDQGCSNARAEQQMEALRKKMREEMLASLQNEDGEAVETLCTDIFKEGQEEVDAMLNSKERTEKEKQEIRAAFNQQMEEMTEFKEELERETQAKQEIEKKLKKMQSRLLGTRGVEDLIAQKEVKETELERRHSMLRERRNSTVGNYQIIAKLQDKQAQVEEKYGSVAEEAQLKGKKLKKIIAKYKNVKEELQELNEDCQREREDLHDSIRQLTNQMKLKSAIIDAFISSDDVQKIIRRAHWDDESESWLLEQLSTSSAANRPGSGKRPVSASSHKRPTSGYAKMVTAMGDLNPRYKSENILQLELDMPERTTSEYQPDAWNERVQAALEIAFLSEEQLLSNVEYIPKDQMRPTSSPFDPNDLLAGNTAVKRPSSARRSSRRASVA